ncbi:MAG: PD-(D/E)XK nuclease family transposase, partial [Clostridiales bacterium]|nr:PD-(D/E)XK nuclease family transposase [Clostridiales bacterium]
MERYNPLNDFVFKKIFGSNENKDLLISLLNAILDPSDRDRLTDLEVVDENQLTKEMIYEKTGRLDVKAKTKCGMFINIEVQLQNQKDFERRTLFYWGKMYIDSIKSGQRYNELEKVITINILDFNYLDIDLFHSKFHLWEDNQKKFLLTDLIEIHFIEMPKFKQVMKKDILNNSLQRWLKFLDKSISENELEELIKLDKSIKKAEKKLEYLSQDPEARKLYEARENAKIEYNSDIGLATEKGRKEGRK